MDQPRVCNLVVELALLTQVKITQESDKETTQILTEVAEGLSTEH